MSALPAIIERGSHAGEAVLPAGPLLDYLARFPSATKGWGNHGDAYGKRQQAAVRRLTDIRATGRVLFDTADELCALLEIHPALLWGDLYWQAAL